MKKQKKCGARCPEHAFTIRPIRKDTFLKQDTHILFCPKQYSNLENLFPQFNRDGKVHTPAFIISIDKNYYEENDQKFLNDHNRKANDYLQKKQIFIPKPNRKEKYCSVCRNNYDDYLQHIKCATHKKCINSSKYNGHILQLCDLLFKNITEKEVIMIEDKQQINTYQNIEKKNSLRTTEYQRKPFKKRKIQKQQIIGQHRKSNLKMDSSDVEILNIIPSVQRIYDSNQFNLWYNNYNNPLMNTQFTQHQQLYENKFQFSYLENNMFNQFTNGYNNYNNVQNYKFTSHLNELNMYNNGYIDGKRGLQGSFMKPQLFCKPKYNNLIIIDDQD